MNTQDALIFYDHVLHRLLGWDIVMSMSPGTSRTDYRTRRAKQASELQRDILLNNPKVDAVVACLEADGDVADLWPAELRDVVRFRVGHKVPRIENEPTSDYSIAQRQEFQNDPYPDWLLEHGEPATVADHPPMPARSAVYKAWEASAR